MSNTIAQHEGQGQARAGTPPKEGDSPAPTDANVGATLVVARVEREGMTLPQGWAWANVEQLAESIQYGYTESAQTEPIGPKFLRITDIQNGRVNWDTVPYCKCSEEGSVPVYSR